MAVAFDAAVESVRTGTADPHSWTHTPSGTPRAIVVAIVHGTSSTDHVNTITYGGVSMSEVIRASDTATEPGDAQLWFLGSGIPTGNQTVNVDLNSATTDDIQFVSMSFTGAADCTVVDSDEVNENAANPSVTLQYGGKYCISVAALYGGGAAPSSFTPNGNCTGVLSEDLGAFYAYVLRQTTPGTSDFAIGGTASLDDVGYVALALSDGMAPIQGFGTTASYTAPTVTTANTTQDVLVRVGSTSVVTSPAFAPEVRPSGYGLTASIGTPVVAVEALPAGFSMTAGLGTPTVETTGGQSVNPAGYGLTASLGSPTETVSSQVTPTGFGLTAELGTPIAGSVASFDATGFGLTADLGTPSETASSQVAPTGYGLTASRGTPTVNAGTDVSPTGFGTTASVGTPTETVSSQVAVTGFGLTASLGTPTTDTGAAPPAEPEPVSARPIPTRWQRVRTAPRYIGPDEAADNRQDTTIAVSGFSLQARAGVTWQVADAVVAPAGQSMGVALGQAQATGMHNPTDEQIIEWLIAALSASV